ncbi:glycosyltransferase family 4 protein [Mesorhizobium sp. 10J20-29]
MRILVFASSYGHIIGGGPVLAPLLMASLAERGHEIMVITDRAPKTLPEDEMNDGVRVLRMPFVQALSGDIALIATLRRQVEALKHSLRPDLVYIFSSGRGEMFHHLTRSAHAAPMVVTLHDLFPPSRYAPEAMVGRNLRSADWIIGCSEATTAWAVKQLPEIGKRATTILNAVPTPAASAIQADRKRLLFPGRLVAKKGCDLALRAFADLSSSDPALRMDIAGDGPEAEALQTLAGDLGIAGKVMFHGGVGRSTLLDLMAGSLAVTVPSRDEPFGLVALEAAHMGRPVVAAAVGGLPEIVLHERTGMLVPPDDVPALTAALRSLIDDPGRADRLGAEAAETARRGFQWNRFVESYEDLFSRIAGT